MTVRELMEALRAFPPECSVHIHYEDDYYGPQVADAVDPRHIRGSLVVVIDTKPI